MTDLVSGNGIVQVSYLHSSRVSHSWHDSMRRMREYDDSLAVRRIAEKPLNIRCGSGGLLVQLRNYAARLFLDKIEHEWFLFTDTDMGFDADAAHRLLAVADPVERPVVGGLCFAQYAAEYDDQGGHRFVVTPTMYRIGTVARTGHARLCFYGDYPADDVVQVAATGAAFLLVHRFALETLRKEHGDTWFNQVVDEDGDIVGEDFSFCLKLGAAGIPVFVHTGVKTTHHKEVWLSEEDYVRQSMLKQLEFQPPDVPTFVDIEASLGTLARDEHNQGGMLKLPADLDRYKQIIEATRPEVIVETGTRTGASARWFAEQGVDVITVDTTPRVGPGFGQEIAFLCGDSADPAVAERVAAMVASRRCMVSLDSDHSGPHVAREIELYGPLVTPGCYLVVEDGIFGYAPPALRTQHGLADMQGSPVDAIVEKLVDNPRWSRDVAIERLHSVSHHPAGFWVCNG